jgi:CheY-like chemotaxis protein
MATQAYRRNFGEKFISPYAALLNSWNRPEVLLVEDGTGVFEEIGYMLLEQGFQVLLAPDAITAMEEIANYQVDIIIVGAGRLDLSGLKLLDLAKSINSEVVTVVLTLGYGVDLPAEAFESEVDCYLGWPVLPARLGRRLLHLLGVDGIGEAPDRMPPSKGLRDQQFWFLLGRFVYEVWNSLNEMKDSLSSPTESRIGRRLGGTSPQLLKLSDTINHMADMVQKFVQDAPWPENLSEPWEDLAEFFQA